MAAVERGHLYAYKLTIDIPNQRITGRLADRMVEMGMEPVTTVGRSFDGIVTVPDWVTAEQVREHVVNECAAEYVGQTVTIRHWEMVPAVREADS